MLENSKIYLHFLLVACLATPVTASWWDDFTNNLATDLTPLIALFGEQATKQFLSESTTFLDNFIFAMAPLGILTGVVSAIRVCGSPSLRAFIGRAQEGGGIAEAELCSSTSRDVCELYHNGAIVRVFGRPKILEIIHDPVLEANEVGNSAVSDDKREYGISISRHYFQRSILNDNRWQEKGLDASDDEAKSGQPSFKTMSNNFAPNPNLSLNIGIVKRSSYVYIMTAIFGFLAQGSVIVLAAVVKYTLKWKKNENTIDPWAFPFVLAGTICVCLGMYLCATLVNDSTKERVFERKDDLSSQNASPSPILYVVQPGNQVVGDQTFDPFLIFKPTNSYITSWKAPSSANSISETRSPTTSRRKMPSLRSMRRPSEEISVLIATLITTLGFALQFVGLRAMHSIVSLLQLAVTIAMSFVRALLRTQRLKIEANILRDRPDEVSSHELDWLALQIGKDVGQPRCSWGVVAQVPSDAPRQAADDKAWEYRCRLAKLTEQPANGNSKLSNAWGNDLVSGRLQAQQLKKAIEDSMSIFIAHAKTKGDLGSMETIPWVLNVAVGKVGKTHDQAPTYQSIDIPLRKQGSLWTVDQSLLEAVIGLWSWSIISDPLTEGETFGFKTSTASDIPIYRAVAAGAESEVQQAWTEIQFWIGEPNATLSSFAMENPSSNKANAATICQHRKDGEQMALDDVDSIKTGSLFGRSDPYQRIFGWHGINILKPFTVGAIRIGLKHIPTLCAQDIYQSFLCSIAACFELENATTTVKREENTMRLEHQLVTQLMACFEASGIGSKQDASLIIIPALQNNALLPRATQAAPTAYRLAETLRRASSFREAEKVLRWAWGMVSGSGELEETAMTELGELYRYALFSKSWHDLGKHGIEWMRSQRNPSMSGLADEVIDRYVSLEKRPRESRTGQHVLDAIIRRQREEALWSISQLEKGDDFPIDEKSGRTVLSLLSQEGWLELVRTVLQIGSVVDSVDSNGRTPLSYAAEHGHLPVVAILMEANALPITEDSSRRTPLSYAAGEGHVSVVEKLLRDPRVNIYSKDMENRSPLHWAATNGCHDAIRYLVNQGAQVDLMDSNHHTPLYAALSNNRRHKVDRWETADLLVELESKTDFMIQGKEAFEWALECGDFTCAEFLWERREAERNIEIVINVEVDGVIWGHMDLSTSSSQVDIKTKLFDHEHNEKEVTMKDVILVAEKGCHMAIHYSLNGLLQKDVICKAGHKIIGTLLDSLQGKADMEKLFVAAASNGENGEAITAALLDHWQTHVQSPIQITNRLAEALISRKNGNKIMGVLLKQRQGNVRITEAAVPVITRRCHVDVMALLLSHLGGRFEVTERVIEDIRINDRANDIMMLLLNQPRGNIPITEAAACLIVRYFDAKVVGLLLSRYGENSMVPEDVVNAAAANRKDGRGVMALLLDQRGLQFQITERTLEAATANPKGRDIVELLLNERGEEFQVTEAIVRSALTSDDGCRGIMKLLFDRRGDQVHITEETLQLAIRKEAGKEVIELLLDSLGEGFEMSEEVMRLALFKGAEKDVIELLLERRGNKLQITEEFFEGAELYFCDRSMIELLLDRLGDQFQITEGIVQLAAAGNRAPAIVELFLDRRGEEIQITEGVLRAAAGNKSCALAAMQLLLDRRGEQVQITEEVLKAAAGNQGNPYEVLNLLLDRQGEQAQITEGVLQAAAGNCEPVIVGLLLDRLGEQVQITEEVLKAAARNNRSAQWIMPLLLDRQGDEVQITKEVLKAAAGNECAAYEVMNLLLVRRRHQVRITEEVIIAAAGNGYVARYLLESLLDECGDQVYVTDAVVKAIVDNEDVDREKLMELLLGRLGEDFHATEKMMEILPAEWTVIRQRIRDVLEHQKEKKQA